MDLATLNAQEDLEKTAEAELFVKLAAENGIDLDGLKDDEVAHLYQQVFPKTAEEGKAHEEGETAEEEKDEEEKKEAAAQEHRRKLAAAAEMRHSEECGRAMARSYVAELNKIGSELIGQQEGGTDEAKEAGARIDNAVKAIRRFGNKAVNKVKHAPEVVGGTARRLAGDMPAGKRLRSAKGQVERTKNVGKAILGGGAAVAAGGAGAAALHRSKESSASSALDDLALAHAVKIAGAGGFDVDEAAERVAAVSILGLEESTKVASTLDQQVEVRALEFLEAAGYPVTWAEQPQ